jgi:preprotein translocase subunit SecG
LGELHRLQTIRAIVTKKRSSGYLLKRTNFIIFAAFLLFMLIFAVLDSKKKFRLCLFFEESKFSLKNSNQSFIQTLSEA